MHHEESKVMFDMEFVREIFHLERIQHTFQPQMPKNDCFQPQNE